MKLKEVLEKIFGKVGHRETKVFLIMLYAFCIPLHQKWSTLILVFLVAVSLPFIKKEKLFYRKFIVLPVLLYLLISISLLYSEQIELRYLLQRASLIAFPIVFSSIEQEQGFQQKIAEYFVLGCVAAILICFGMAFYNSFSVVNGEILFKPIVNDEFSFLYSVVRDGNYFFSSHFSIFHQTTYFAIYLNCGIAAILAFSLWKKRKVYLFLLILFLVVIFQLSAKVGMLTTGVIFLIYGLQKTDKIWAKAFLFLTVTVLAVFFISKNPRGRAMVNEFKQNGFSVAPDERYGYGLRLLSWDAALEVILKSQPFGVGIGDTQLELDKIYLKKGYTKPLKEHFNAHNQFLQILLATGICGLIVLMLMLWELYKKANGSNKQDVRLFSILFLTLITLAFSFESVLNRYSGISFFVFFYLLISQRVNT